MLRGRTETHQDGILYTRIDDCATKFNGTAP
jgi:hypothetical protein